VTATTNYKVKLKKFEGPLDLLLSLTEKEKLNIIEVPLSKVADDYIDYIRQAESLDLAQLTDFLVIASQLLVIKSRALLPTLERPEDDDVDEALLKKRLIEYKRFRDAGSRFGRLIAERRFLFERPLTAQTEQSFLPPEEISQTALAHAFRSVISDLPDEEMLDLDEQKMRKTVSLSDKITEIKDNISATSNLVFSRVFRKAKSKTEIVVSFLAVLELLKQRLITVEQNGLFEEIEIKTFQE
jgi:segregation and condensation protein A